MHHEDERNRNGQGWRGRDTNEWDDRRFGAQGGYGNYGYGSQGSFGGMGTWGQQGTGQQSYPGGYGQGAFGQGTFGQGGSGGWGQGSWNMQQGESGQGYQPHDEGNRMSGQGSYGQSGSSYGQSHGQGPGHSSSYGQGWYGQNQGQGSHGQGQGSWQGYSQGTPMSRGYRDEDRYPPQGGRPFDQRMGQGGMGQGSHGTMGHGWSEPWQGSQQGWSDRNRDWPEPGRQGTRGFTGKGPRGYRKSDQRLHEDVSDALTRDPSVDASEIDVKVESGEVTLTGTVQDRNQKRMAEMCAERVEGVNDVHNHIRVQNEQRNPLSQMSTSSQSNRDNESTTQGMGGSTTTRATSKA